MKKILLLLLLPFMSFSQEKNEVINEPNPYVTKPYFDYINKTKIKKVSILIRDKSNKFKNDTLEVCSYNKLGQKNEVINYENNLRRTNTKIKFDKNDNQIEWVMVDKSTVTKTSFEYNVSNKILKTETSNMRNNTLINKTIQTYEYGNKKLNLKNTTFNNLKQKTEIFIYNNKDQLSEYKSELLQGGNFITKYIYSDNQLTKRKTNTYLVNNIVELWNEKNFIFENGKLLKDEELTYSNVKDSAKIINEYNYNDDKSLKKIISKYKNDYREIEFKYESNNLKKIEVHTNSNNALLKFTIPYGIEKKDFPVFYEEEFYYDKKNNVTSKKLFLNKILIRELEFKIEYY